MFRNRVWVAAKNLGVDVADLTSFATINAGLDLRTQNESDNQDSKDIGEIVAEMRKRTGLEHSIVIIEGLPPEKWSSLRYGF